MKHVLAAAMPLLLTGVVAAQTAPINLPATPSTVVWGYYSAKAKPVLTIHSGDTVHIQTLSTCGPTERLEEEGVAAADIPPYNADIYREVKDKGPGGHILTGPVDIAEAEPGDAPNKQKRPATIFNAILIIPPRAPNQYTSDYFRLRR